MRKVFWLLLGVCFVIDILLATWTWQEVRDTIGWVKMVPQKTEFKIRHIIQYTPQAFLLGLCLDQFNLSLSKKSGLAILGITFIGILTEVIQAYIPSRIPAFMDVVWNFSAACLGALIFYLYKLKKNQA